MQAIILAGGFGTRLKDVLGKGVPKPMAPVAGEPFLAHFLRGLQCQGVGEVVLAVHHLADAVKAYFGDNFAGMTLRYLHENQPLGTGGAIRQALGVCAPGQPVLVCNGDSFARFDVNAMLAAHHASEACLTVGLAQAVDCRRYGEVQCDAMWRITRFTYPGRAVAGWVSTGIYLMQPELFDGYAVPEVFSFERDFQQVYVNEIGQYGWPGVEDFLDIGVPEAYARAPDWLKRYAS